MLSVFRLFLLICVNFSFLAAELATAKAVSLSPVPSLGSGLPLSIDEEEFNTTYQIGEEWGKVPVTPEKIGQSQVLKRTAGATARVGGATGFYLGQFQGVHIVATNNHVCPSSRSCRWQDVRFPQLGKSYRPDGVIGSWPEIDLAFLKIKVEGEDEALKAVARNFSFNARIYPGQKLVTIGFGVANNRRRQMVMNKDSDCITFSGESEYRHMADPDELNRGPHKVWSFANGCDVSHGDSGSAIVDRTTGDVIGIIWTGKIPKNARVRNSRYLQEILSTQSEDIWQELSYSVPAAKMKDVLVRELRNGGIAQKDRAAMTELLGL